MQTRMMAAVSRGIEMAAIKSRAIKFAIGQIRETGVTSSQGTHTHTQHSPHISAKTGIREKSADIERSTQTALQELRVAGRFFASKLVYNNVYKNKPYNSVTIEGWTEIKEHV